jgi:hypothetical protein
MIGAEPLRDGLDFRRGLRHGHSGLEPRDRCHAPHVGEFARARPVRDVAGEWHVQLDRLARQVIERETSRQYADDFVRHGVHHDATAHSGEIGIKVPAPEAVGENHDAVAARSVIVRDE